MKKTGVEDFSAQGLNIRVVDDGKQLSLFWTGEVSVRDPGKLLDAYLTHVGTEAAAAGRALGLDFSSMAFMNSASLVPVMRCLQLLSEKSVTTLVFYNSGASWQRVSYSCMQVLVKKLNGITVQYRK